MGAYLDSGGVTGVGRITAPDVTVEEDEEEVDMEDEAAAQLAKNCDVGSSGRVAGSGMEPGPPRPSNGKGNAGGGGGGLPAADMATEAAAAWR